MIIGHWLVSASLVSASLGHWRAMCVMYWYRYLLSCVWCLGTGTCWVVCDVLVPVLVELCVMYWYQYLLSCVWCIGTGICWVVCDVLVPVLVELCVMYWYRYLLSCVWCIGTGTCWVLMTTRNVLLLSCSPGFRPMWLRVRTRVRYRANVLCVLFYACRWVICFIVKISSYSNVTPITYLTRPLFAIICSLSCCQTWQFLLLVCCCCNTWH